MTGWQSFIASTALAAGLTLPAAAQEPPTRWGEVPAWEVEFEVREVREELSGVLAGHWTATGRLVVHAPTDYRAYGDLLQNVDSLESVSPEQALRQMKNIPEELRNLPPEMLENPHVAALLKDLQEDMPELEREIEEMEAEVREELWWESPVGNARAGAVHLAVRGDETWNRTPDLECEVYRTTRTFTGPPDSVEMAMAIRPEEGRFWLDGAFSSAGVEERRYRHRCDQITERVVDGVGFQVEAALPGSGLVISGSEVISIGYARLEVTYTIRPLPPCPFEIISPAADQQFVFSAARPGRLRIPLEVRFEGDECGDGAFEWSADGIEGSQQRFSGGGAAGNHGTKAVLEYIGLPREHDQFGEKEVRVSLGDGYEAAVSIEVFYPPEARNHPAAHPAIQKMSVDVPDQDVPNWFYYWSQGAVPGLEDFRYVDAPDLSAGQSRFGWSDTGTGELFVGPDAGGSYPGYSIRLLKTVDASRFTPTQEQCTTRDNLQRTISGTDGIGSAARVVVHEKDHLARFNSYGDWDADGLGPGPGSIWEDGDLCLGEGASDSHGIAQQLGGGNQKITGMYSARGDFELLAILAEKSARYAAPLDWSCGGKQWTGGACPN